MFLSCFPPTVHETASPSLPGVPSGRFPRLRSMKRSDSPAVLLAALRFLRFAMPSVRPLLTSPRPHGHGAIGSDLELVGGISDRLARWKTAGSPSSQGIPCDHSPLFFDPGVTRRLSGPWLALGQRAPRLQGRGLTARRFRGSIARRLISLSTLRRGRHPPTTQDSLPAAGPALPDGIGYPQGSQRKVSSFRLSSFPELSERECQFSFPRKQNRHRSTETVRCVLAH